MTDALVQAGLRRVLADPALFSQHVIGRALRPYQLEPLRALVQAVQRRQGHTFTVMFARQMGKNELSAHLECYLLNVQQRRGGSIVKTAPTYQPQTVNSKLRLMATLDNPLNQGQWWVRDGYRVGLGKAACLFVSGHEEARVVGLTASLLLEVDEAQDMSEDKYGKDFRPMASSTNAPSVLYGTAWTGETLLERQAALNRELDRRDGSRRHFQFDWQTLAAQSPAYRAFVAAPGINRSLIQDLATSAFVTRHDSILLCGSTGVGKNHLANGLACAALKRVYRVLSRSLHRLLLDLHAARGNGAYNRVWTRLVTCDVLVLDDFGLQTPTPQGVQDLYDIIAERYERRSVILTSNRAFGEWAGVFNNDLLASAALDRLTHHTHTLVIQGESYRQRSRHKEAVGIATALPEAHSAVSGAPSS